MRVANGTGGAASKDDDIRIYEVKADTNYSYTPNKPMLSLDGYTFENDDHMAGLRLAKDQAIQVHIQIQLLVGVMKQILIVKMTNMQVVTILFQLVRVKHLY